MGIMGYNRNNYQRQYQGRYQGQYQEECKGQYQEECKGHEKCEEEHKHVHEIQGSLKMACEYPHHHRFCTVSEEAMSVGDKDHVHEVCFRTDTYDKHFHEFKGKTGCAIPVGNGKHVHFLDSVTSVNDGHRHKFECATLIDNPTGMEYKKDCNDHRDSRY